MCILLTQQVEFPLHSLTAFAEALQVFVVFRLLGTATPTSFNCYGNGVFSTVESNQAASTE
jgi:hypothetical protein